MRQSLFKYHGSSREVEVSLFQKQTEQYNQGKWDSLGNLRLHPHTFEFMMLNRVESFILRASQAIVVLGRVKWKHIGDTNVE